MVAGMLVTFLLYKFANLFLDRFLILKSKGKRLKMVIFGTLYVLVFVIGNMVEINGILGIVDSISTYHTHLRTLDGNIVFIPNALVMASRIVNYHQTPNRRIELKVSVGAGCDLNLCKKFLFEIMSADDRVLSDPAPAVFVLDANAVGVEMVGFCWIGNDDWLTTRSDLWLHVVDRFQSDPAVNLSLEKQEVLLSGEVKKS